MAREWEAVGWILVDATGMKYHRAPANAEEAVLWRDDLNAGLASVGDERYTLPFVIRDLYEHPNAETLPATESTRWDGERPTGFGDYSLGDLTAFVARYASRLKWDEAEKVATALVKRFPSSVRVMGATEVRGESVRLDAHGVPTLDVKGYTTHDSPVRLFYHGNTLDMLEVVLPPSFYREPKGGPERRATVRLADLQAALEAVSARKGDAPRQTGGDK